MTRTLTLFAFAALAVSAQEGQFDRTLKVNGPVDLTLATDSGGIVVVAGPAGTVTVHAKLKAQQNWFTGGDLSAKVRRLEQHPPIDQSGNTIRIGMVSDPELLKGVSMRLEITAPADTKLRARADSGGIRVDGLKGPVDCHTDSGGVEIRNAAAEVRASADSGGIRIRNVRGPVYAKSDSGGIEALEVAGSIDAQVDSGGLRLSQTAPGAIRARADSGGADIRLAPKAGYDVKARSGSGRVSVSDVAVRGTLERNRVDGKVRGGGPLVDVQVESGHVTVE